MKFAIWAAVSSLPQAKKISLDDQVAEARQHVERHNGEVTAVLRVPGQSRSIVLFEDACKRIAAYAELRDLIHQRAFDVLIYLDRSRLGRKASLSMAVVELCHEAGIQTYEMESPPSSLTHTQSHDDALIGAIKSVGAQREVEKLTSRHRAGMIGRAKAGKFPNFLPYGYKYVYDSHGEKHAEIDEDEASIMRHALLDLYMDKAMAMTQVATELNALGYVYRSGDPWKPHHIERMLNNLIKATGKVELNKRSKRNRPYIIADGQHAAILSDDEAAAILEHRQARKQYIRRPKSPWLFSGVLTCATCGNPLHAGDWRKKTRVYVCTYNFCKGSRVHEPLLIEHLRDAIHYVSEQANRDALIAAKTDTGTVEALEQIDRLRARVQEIDGATERLVRAYVDLAAITDEEFTEQKRRLAENRTVIIERLAELRERERESVDLAAYPLRLEDIAQRGLSQIERPTREANAWIRQHFEILIADYTVEEIRYL